jgi:DNA replication protein
MIKKLYEEHFLEIDSLLTKESKRLKLSPNELVVLKTLFQMYKKKTFSVTQIAKKIELTVEEISKALNKLTSKGFVTLALETRNDKQVEVFDLTGTFDKITALYLEDIKEEKQQKYDSQIATVIEMIEHAQGKTLSPFELETVKSWYYEKEFEHELIISKIHEHGESGRFGVKFLERILTQSKLKQGDRDEKTQKALDEIFKAIK